MDKYKELLRVAKQLNNELKITPVLYGSLGLSKIIQKDLNSQDIDILVPQKYITTEWDRLIKTFQKINYQLINERA
jgi:phage terminase large subunit-like protein